MQSQEKLIIDSNKRIIIEAFKNGRGCEKIAAYHGTSLQVLESIIRKGRQYGSDFIIKDRKVHLSVRRGDIFVLPIEGRSDIRRIDGYNNEAEAFLGASAYATASAHAHYIINKIGNKLSFSMEHLGVELDFLVEYYNPRVKLESTFIEVRKAFNYLKRNGLTKDEIGERVTEARKKNGLVIGYTQEIFEKGEPLPGNDRGDIRVQNVTINSIVGIEPLDEECYDFLDSLDKS